jgi:8-oxo-dGTP diphosphatase
MNQYVLGFAFDHRFRNVLLINKVLPDWQRGKLNGVGGKIQITETAFEAMTREFHEEVGIYTSQDKWRLFCQLTGVDYTVYCYATEMPFISLLPMTDERPEWVSYLILPTNIVHDLNWLIPMAVEDVTIYAEVDKGAHNAHR